MTSMLTGSFPGEWWRPNAPDRRVAGVLSIDYDGLSVELIGSFGRLEEMGRVRALPVLHGTTTGGLFVTLIDSIVADESVSTRAMDIRSTRLRPGSALIGDHIDKPREANWLSASIELERMTAWASPPGFERSLDLTEDRHLAGASFRYEAPPDVEVRIPGAALAIGPRQSIAGDLVHEARITVNVSATFDLDEPASFEEISQRLLKPLLNLVILATQKPTSIISFRLASQMEGSREWIEVVSRRPSPDTDERKRLYPMDALFLLPDLMDASPVGIGTWYEAAAKLERAFDLVSAIRSSTRLFLDHRLLNAATAAESYHEARIDGRVMPRDAWTKVVEAAVAAAETPELGEQVRNRMSSINNPSLRDRIQALIDRGGEPLVSLQPEPEVESPELV